MRRRRIWNIEIRIPKLETVAAVYDRRPLRRPVFVISSGSREISYSETQLVIGFSLRSQTVRDVSTSVDMTEEISAA